MNDIVCGHCGGHDIRERPNGEYYCPDCSKIHKHNEFDPDDIVEKPKSQWRN